MSDTTTTTTEAKRRPGRPKGPRPALTSAERMRQARERVRFALDDPQGDITTLPDQLLLEAVALAYRKDRPEALFYGVEELFKRLAASETGDHTYMVHLERIPKGDTVTEKYSVTVTEKESEDTDTVTDTPALDLEPTTPEPADRDARILALHRQGVAKRAIGRELGLAESTVRSVIQRLSHAEAHKPLSSQ